MRDGLELEFKGFIGIIHFDEFVELQLTAEYGAAGQWFFRIEPDGGIVHPHRLTIDFRIESEHVVGQCCREIQRAGVWLRESDYDGIPAGNHPGGISRDVGSKSGIDIDFFFLIAAGEEYHGCEQAGGKITQEYMAHEVLV